MDPFATLGVEARFDLDEMMLAERQRELSLALHPDRFAGRPANERRAALGKAIEVNQAYRLIKDPISRAEALLERWGMALGEGERPSAHAELLMEMMELRESLSEAAAKRDVEKIEQLLDTVKAQEVEARRALSQVMVELSAARAANSAPAYAVLGTLRYLRRFLDEGHAFLDELV